MLEEEQVLEEKVEEQQATEEPKQEPTKEQPQEKTPTQNALIGFILAVVASGIVFGGLWNPIVMIVFGAGCFVLGVLAFNFNRRAGEVGQQPFRTFSKVTNIVSRVEVAAGAVLVAVGVIWGIVRIIEMIIAAAAE